MPNITGLAVKSMGLAGLFLECLVLPVDNYGYALECPRKAKGGHRYGLAMIIPRRPVIALYGVWHGSCNSIRWIIPANPASNRDSGKGKA